MLAVHSVPHPLKVLGLHARVRLVDNAPDVLPQLHAVTLNKSTHVLGVVVDGAAGQCVRGTTRLYYRHATTAANGIGRRISRLATTDTHTGATTGHTTSNNTITTSTNSEFTRRQRQPAHS